MSKLDNLTPSYGELYNCELLVESEWVIKAMLTKDQIIKWSEALDEIQD